MFFDAILDIGFIKKELMIIQTLNKMNDDGAHKEKQLHLKHRLQVMQLLVIIYFISKILDFMGKVK